MKDTNVFECTAIETIEGQSKALVYKQPISASGQKVAEAKLVEMARDFKKLLDLDTLEITCIPFRP